MARQRRALAIMPPMKPVFFPTPARWRAWLERNHQNESEVLVGFYKRDSGKPSITWPQSVDEALCFGWIDGVRRSVDEDSYTIRFTPRKPRSRWSLVNVRRVKELTRLGLMQPRGLEAFAACESGRSGTYAYEQRKTARFAKADERQFRANTKAWSFFQAQAPWYRRTSTWWVISAKKRETQLKRLATVIDCSARGVAIHQLARNKPA